ncbi:MAG: hypothetical protein CMB79_04000 [Filomicrobium sp.]|nr:hypothetical protein [Filomicrobium sp.]
MIEKLQNLVNDDAALVNRGRWMSADMLLQIGDTGHLVEIRKGRIENVSPANVYVTPYDFKIRGTEEAWQEFWKPLPKPRHHDIIALIREGKMQMEGNIEMAMANFLTLKLMLEKPRKVGGAS